MVSLHQVSVVYGGFTLFKDVSFLVGPRERLGLVGKNGAGKSTILKIIVGEVSPTGGVLSVPKDITIGYLPQQMEVANSRSVIREAMQAFSETLQLEKDIKRLTRELETRTDYESNAYTEIIHQLTERSERLSMIGSDSMEAQAELALRGLGFKRSDLNRPTSEFSGGWRMRIELAKILLRKPNVLLLDEPTNHLDIESIQWLEDYLKGFPGSLVLISHDRAFLDNITERTVELSLGKAFDYRVSYSKYVELRRERREQQMAAYRNQQKLIDDTQDFIDRFRYKATKANQVQSRIRQLEKLEIIEVDDEDNSALTLRFPPAPRSGDVVVKVDDVGKRYGEHTVFSKSNFVLTRGEKIALVGRNGEGKTTMSRIIMGELQHDGKVTIGHNVNRGYFAQNQDELMDPSDTVLDTIDRVAVGEIRTRIRDILGAFMFRGEDVDKKVGVLSGGERNRLAMVKLMLQPYNLLILDEPTNHLDMRSKDILKSALQGYNGTVIIVSHDREFLNGLVSKVYEFRDGRVKEHLGGIYDFLAKRKLESLKELETQAKPAQERPPKAEMPQSNEQRTERREREKELRRMETRLKSVEADILKLENEIDLIGNQLSSPEQSPSTNSNDLYSKYQQVKEQLSIRMGEWEKLAFSIEEVKEQG